MIIISRIKCHLTRQHLDHHDSKRPNINLCWIWFIKLDLGSLIVQISGRILHQHFRLTFFVVFWQSKINQMRLMVLIKHDVISCAEFISCEGRNKTILLFISPWIVFLEWIKLICCNSFRDIWAISSSGRRFRSFKYNFSDPYSEMFEIKIKFAT